MRARPDPSAALTPTRRHDRAARRALAHGRDHRPEIRAYRLQLGPRRPLRQYKQKVVHPLGEPHGLRRPQPARGGRDKGAERLLARVRVAAAGGGGVAEAGGQRVAGVCPGEAHLYAHAAVGAGGAADGEAAGEGVEI
jgi:hypothetical protein